MAVRNESEAVMLQEHLWLRWLSLASVVFGVLVSAYMSYHEILGTAVACTTGGAFNCSVVQNSAYAHMFGVPVALWGLLTYLLIGALLLVRSSHPVMQENGNALLLILVFGAFLFSMYLIYLQGVVLQAWCMWCLMHEINITVLLLLTGMRWWASMGAMEKRLH